MARDSLSSGWRRFVKHNNLPHIRIHDLRHSHATLMLHEGIHPTPTHSPPRSALPSTTHAMVLGEAAEDDVECGLERFGVAPSM